MLIISSRGCAIAHYRKLWQNLQTHIERLLPFGTLFNNISQRENMIDTSPSSPETCLFLAEFKVHSQ